MIALPARTYRSLQTANGHLVIRIDVNGYELVWEIVSSARKAAARCRFWQAVEAEELQP